MGQFDNLSGYDFELLMADLLGAEFKRRFETFPQGRDGGIDLRSRMLNGVHLVQCKHWPEASVGRLETAAKAECKKIAALTSKPRRYTFVTSRKLTAGNKKTLIGCLHPYVRNESDVLGANDLEGLLRAHERVERSHVKLWLTRAAPLDRIVNAEVYARSEAVLAEINATLPRYVQTDSFAEASKLLHEHNVVVIAGPPGVGKTTLARLLMFESATSNYVPYSVQSDIAEAWRLFKPDEPQVFFFDDFLGRTALFDNVQKDPRDLANFISRVRKSKATRLILATREYVLQQAQHDVEEFKWKALEAEKFSLTLESYSRLERAHIFYNHIFSSQDVDAAARRSLLAKRGYLKVIDHPSYSPRLIEWMTGLGGHRLTDSDRADYTAYCLSVLDHPEQLWQHAFDFGLDRGGQMALLALVSLPLNVTLEDFATAFDSAAPQFNVPRGKRAMEGAVKVLQESFLTVSDRMGGKQMYVSVLNPSLEDFLRERLQGNTDDLTALLQGAAFFEQVAWIYRLRSDDARPLTNEESRVFASAIERTLEVDSPKSLVYSIAQRLRLQGFESRSRRLTLLASWVAEQPRLRTAMKPAMKSLLAPELDEVEQMPTAFLEQDITLIGRLRDAGLSDGGLAAAVRDRAISAGDDVHAYEALSDLRRVASELFPIRQWADIQDRFAAWAFYVLDEPTGYFDDADDFDRFERVAEDLGTALGDDELTRARDAIDEAVAEREAEAADEVEPDEDDDDRGRHSYDLGAGDDAEIDSLFGSLDYRGR